MFGRIKKIFNLTKEKPTFPVSTTKDQTSTWKDEMSTRKDEMSTRKDQTSTRKETRVSHYSYDWDSTDSSETSNKEVLMKKGVYQKQNEPDCPEPFNSSRMKKTRLPTNFYSDCDSDEEEESREELKGQEKVYDREQIKPFNSPRLKKTRYFNSSDSDWDTDEEEESSEELKGQEKVHDREQIKPFNSPRMKKTRYFNSSNSDWDTDEEEESREELKSQEKVHDQERRDPLMKEDVYQEQNKPDCPEPLNSPRMKNTRSSNSSLSKWDSDEEEKSREELKSQEKACDLEREEPDSSSLPNGIIQESLQREEESELFKDRMTLVGVDHQEEVKSLTHKLSEAETQVHSLKEEVLRVTLQLKEKVHQIDVLQNDKLAAQDRAHQAKLFAEAHDKNTQEQLAQAHSECQLLRQQLEEVKNQREAELSAMTNSQQHFNHMQSKHSDCEERVQLLEDKNMQLLSKVAELQCEVYKLEEEKNESEASQRQLQQELSDTLEKLSKSEASLKVNTQYCTNLEMEKVCILRNVDRLKEKLAEKEAQCAQALQEAVMVRGQLQKLGSNLQSRNVSLETLEDQLSTKEQKQSTVLLSAQEYQALREKEVGRCSKLELRVSELEKEKEELAAQKEIVKKKARKIVEKKAVDARLEQEMTRNAELQTEVQSLCTSVKTVKTQHHEKMKDLQVQLDRETLRRHQLEKDNCDLQDKLTYLKRSLQKSERLEEELRAQMEATQSECRQVKERTRQDLLTKFDQVTYILRTQVASQQQEQRICELRSGQGSLHPLEHSQMNWRGRGRRGSSLNKDSQTSFAPDTSSSSSGGSRGVPKPVERHVLGLPRGRLSVGHAQREASRRHPEQMP